jgi:hypothetical protein
MGSRELPASSEMLLCCENCNSNVPYNAFLEHNARCVGSRAGMASSWDRMMGRLRRTAAHDDASDELATAISRLQIVVPPYGQAPEDHPLHRNIAYDHDADREESLFGQFEYATMPPTRRRALATNNISSSQLFDDQWEEMVASFYEGNDYEFNLMLAETMGKVEVGVADVSKVTSPISPLDAVDLAGTCPICFDTFDELRDVGLCKTTCNHYFCRTCIGRWLGASKKCPVCMQALAD